jgi:hypothetical protein
MQEKGNRVAVIGYRDYQGNEFFYNLFAARQQRDKLFFGILQLKSIERVQRERAFRVVEEHPISGISTRLVMSGTLQHIYPCFFKAIATTYRQLQEQGDPSITGQYLGHKSRLCFWWNTDYGMQISIPEIDTDLSNIHPRKLGIVLGKKEGAPIAPLVRAIERETREGRGKWMDWDNLSTEIAASEESPYYLASMARLHPEIQKQILAR